MPRGDGPHRHSFLPGREYRGSNKRIEQLSPVSDLPRLLLVIGVALAALGFCALLMYRSL